VGLTAAEVVAAIKVVLRVLAVTVVVVATTEATNFLHPIYIYF